MHNLQNMERWTLTLRKKSVPSICSSHSARAYAHLQGKQSSSTSQEVCLPCFLCTARLPWSGGHSGSPLPYVNHSDSLSTHCQELADQLPRLQHCREDCAPYIAECLLGSQSHEGLCGGKDRAAAASASGVQRGHVLSLLGSPAEQLCHVFCDPRRGSRHQEPGAAGRCLCCCGSHSGLGSGR